MFEQAPEGAKKLRPAAPWKLLAISAGGLLLAAGLCGVDAHLYPHSEFGGSALAGIGALLFVGSTLSLAVAVLWIIIRAIAGFFKH